MDPLRIVVRAVFVYVMLLVLMRLSGKHTVTQSSPFDFTLSLILGDIVDDAIWAEVHLSLFAMAAVSLVTIHAGVDMWRAGAS